MALGGLTADALFDLLPEPALVLATKGRGPAAAEFFEFEGGFEEINVTDLLPAEGRGIGV